MAIVITVYEPVGKSIIYAFSFLFSCILHYVIRSGATADLTKTTELAEFSAG